MAMYDKTNLIYPGLVIPYSSSWLVCMTILKWNSIRNFRELREMFQIHSESENMDISNNWCSSEQAFQWRLESSLGLQQNELKSSFFNAWFPFPNKAECSGSYSRPQVFIRHCSECIKFGYHSVIFYFEHISHCPWHNEELEYCHECTTVLGNNWPIKKGIYGSAGRCAHLDFILDVSAPNMPSAEYIDEVEAWCSLFMDWVHCSSKLIGNTAYEIIATKSSARFQDKQAAIDFLVERFGFPGVNCRLSKRMTIMKLPRSKLAWEIPYQNILQSPRMRTIRWQQPQIDEKSEISILKSIRRYIFHTYLRSHRRCLAGLKSLSKDDWCRLNAETICPCVMAYLILFSNLSFTSPYELLHSRRTFSFIKRPCWGAVLKCETELLAFHYLRKYFMIWNALRNSHKVAYKFLAFSNRYEASLFPIKFPGYFDSSLLCGRGAYWDCYCFFENPEVSLEASRPYCAARRTQSLCLALDESFIDNFLNNENVQCVIHSPSLISEFGSRW